MKTILKTGLITGIVLTILWMSLNLSSGVKVEIVNLGPIAMKNVSVVVTGSSYPIGDIPAGESSWVKVEPQGESSISIEHTNNGGERNVLSVDTYIESGYSGRITAQIKDGKITHVEQNIKLTPLG